MSTQVCLVELDMADAVHVCTNVSLRKPGITMEDPVNLMLLISLLASLMA